MTLYRIEEGRKATHIAIEAECVNHYDWNALHILHSRTEAIKTAEWYMTDGDITYTARGFRYSNREVMSDSYICYHINNEWIYLSEGEPVKVSDLRKADAIMAGGADDEMAWADNGERVTVYLMDGDSLRVDIDVNELDDDCEVVNVSNLDERDMNELEIIRIKPTAQTAAAIAEQCNHYAHNTLKQCADAIITIIANPANDGRWTDADSVKDIIWEAYDELKNIAQESGADMSKEWWKDARTLEAVNAAALEAAEAPQTADNDSTTDNTHAIMEAVENAHKSRYSARQTAPLTFAIWDNVKNAPIIETTANGITAYMEIFGIDRIDTDTAEPTDADTTTDTDTAPDAPITETERRAALDRLNHAQNAANLFTNIAPADIDREVMRGREAGTPRRIAAI